MTRKCLHLFLLLTVMTLLTVFSSCRKEQYEEDTLVTLVIKNSSYDYGHFTRSDSDSYAITICVEGRNVKERHHIRAKGETISVPLRLPPDRYNVHIWMDGCGNCRDSSALPYISVKPHEKYSPTCDAQGGSLEVVTDLSPSEHIIELKRPLAKIRVITEDFTDNTPSGLTATIVYTGFFPSMFNVYSFVPCDAGTGYSFSVPVASEILGEDHIFCDDKESFVMATVVVSDSNNQRVAETRNIKIPYKQGYTTTVSGDFLSPHAPGSGGITIDTEWDGEYEVEF